MESNPGYRSDSKAHNKFSSPSTSRVSSPFPFQPARSKFIGSFIHEANFDSRVKQRPSKRARQRIRKRLAKLEVEDKGNKISPESGYDTTSGDCQTPGFSSPEKGSFKLTEIHQSPQSTKKEVKQERNNLLPAADEPSESNTVPSRVRTTSVSSVSSLITDKNLRRPLKDLHRCEVSIAKYEAMLSDKCEEGEVQLRDVFSRLRHRIDVRETDLRKELAAVGDNAAAILERRKRTARYLKQASEQVANLEEPQIDELKQQIKQFVTDRRVDEEIGTITRFQADLDDILRHVMGFGKVNNVRHLYTEWEENPGEAIEMSKHRLSFPISAHHQFTSSIDSEIDSCSPSHSITSSNNIASSRNNSSVSLQTEKETVSLPPFSSAEQNNNSKNPKERTVLKEPPQVISQQASDGTDGQSASGTNEPVAMKPDAVADSNRTNKPICALTIQTEIKKTEEPIEEQEGLDTVEDDGQSDKKIAPSELLLKQARVRESLKMQGVFLYDPITGEGPPPTPPPQATPLDMTMIADHDLRSLSPASRKKKTPTQLRRERKKRQKERERRQSDIERKVREDSSKSTVSSTESSDSKTPDIPSTDNISSTSGVEEEAGSKVIWSHAPLGSDDRDASSENSESENSPIDCVVQIANQTLATPQENYEIIITVETPRSDINTELDQDTTIVSTDDQVGSSQLEPNSLATNSSTSEISIPQFEDEPSSDVPSLKQLATVVATVTEVTSLPSNQLELDDKPSYEHQSSTSVEQQTIGAPSLDYTIADNDVPAIGGEDEHQPLTSVEQQTIAAPSLDSSDEEHRKLTIADNDVPAIDGEDDHQPLTSVEQQTIAAPYLDSSDEEHRKLTIADNDVPAINGEDDRQPLTSLEQQTIAAPPLDYTIADNDVPAINGEDEHQPLTSLEQQTIAAPSLDSSDEEHRKLSVEEHSQLTIADNVPAIDGEDDHQPLTSVEQQTIAAPSLDSSDEEHRKLTIADNDVPAIDGEDDHQPLTSVEQQTIAAPPLDSSDEEHSQHTIADNVPAIDGEDVHQPLTSVEQQTIAAPPLDSSDEEHSQHTIADNVPAIDGEDVHQPLTSVEQQTIAALSDGEHIKHIITDSAIDVKDVSSIDREE